MNSSQTLASLSTTIMTSTATRIKDEDSYDSPVFRIRSRRRIRIRRQRRQRRRGGQQQQQQEARPRSSLTVIATALVAVAAFAISTRGPHPLPLYPLLFSAAALVVDANASGAVDVNHGDGDGNVNVAGSWETVMCRMYETSALLTSEADQEDRLVRRGGSGGSGLETPRFVNGWKCLLLQKHYKGEEQAQEQEQKQQQEQQQKQELEHEKDNHAGGVGAIGGTVAYDVVPALPPYAIDLMLSSSLGRGVWGGGGGGVILEIRGARLDNDRYSLSLSPHAEFRTVDDHDDDDDDDDDHRHRPEGLFHPARRKGNFEMDVSPVAAASGAQVESELLHRETKPESESETETEALLTSGRSVSPNTQSTSSWRISGGSDNGGGDGNGNGTGMKRFGTSTVLILRICDTNGCPPFTASAASDAVFGTRGDQDNLSHQYDLCSAHKLNFVPAWGPGIVDGVMEVRLGESIAGKSRTAAENLAADAAVELYAMRGGGTRRSLDRLADHVCFALPPGTEGSWNAEGYYGWYRTLFNKDKLLYLSYQMHEIAHNLDLRHSGKGSSIYGDTSGYQGYTYAYDDAPRMCFNAAKSWEAGWYSDRHSTAYLGDSPLSPYYQGDGSGSITATSGAWSGDLVGVVDYEAGRTSVGQTVVLRIPDLRWNNDGGGGATALYVMYNRAKGFNDQTGEFADQVTVVRAGPPDPLLGDRRFNTHVTSYAEGSISLGSSSSSSLLLQGGQTSSLRSRSRPTTTSIYREKDFDGSISNGGGGHALEIELCRVSMGNERNDEPDVATVVVRLVGVHDLSCRDVLQSKDRRKEDGSAGSVVTKQRVGGGGREKRDNRLQAVNNENSNGGRKSSCVDDPSAHATLGDRRARCRALASRAEELRDCGSVDVGIRRSRRFRRRWCTEGTAAEVCRRLCSPWIDECRGSGGNGVQNLFSVQDVGNDNEGGCGCGCGGGCGGLSLSGESGKRLTCEDSDPDAVASLHSHGGSRAAFVVEDGAIMVTVSDGLAVATRTCSQLHSNYEDRLALGGEEGEARARRFRARWCSPAVDNDGDGDGGEKGGYSGDAIEKCAGFCREYISGCAMR